MSSDDNHSNPKAPPENADAALLATLGYKQEFKRAFHPVELFGVGFSIIGLLPSIASVLVYAIPNGGPVAMVWGWAATTPFLVIIGLALGELGSSMPTSGGLYYWTHSYASPRWRNVLAWVVGYANTMGNVAGLAGIDWGCAVQISAAASIGSNMSFSATTAQTFGIYAAILFSHAIIGSTATRVIARLQWLYIVLNVLLVLGIIIAVPAATPKEFHNSASYAFGGFTNFNGWPDGFAFILSFLAPLWTIGGFDAAIHISEEASNAAVAVPWAIVSAVGIACALGWVINVVLAFYMGTDMASLLDSPIEQPMAAIFFNCFGQKGTLAIWAIIIAVQFMMGTSILVAASRQTFAFSRDGALPFSRVLYRINPTTRTPINCVWFAALLALLLGLLAFEGGVAISAVFALAVVGQYIAYTVPIASRFLFARDAFRPGPFYLGRFSAPVGIIAVLWMVFSIAILLFPTSPHPAASDMNYTVAVSGGVVALSLVYYYFPVYGGKHWFTGPVRNVAVGGGGAGASEVATVEGEEDSEGPRKSAGPESGGADVEKRRLAERLYQV
ncbi:APC amino acid permease [Punctularia strigosozonata HHB-11173 SS5]|uniref:APC amino acid permease n=1 Tax=Punctularia strigosozonata (strain HHB-11173) TaxID=741275 RepID=UPI0004416AD1|nr:APC amino acid permease [Punctularia strigosozonata HHB-11173 SS5]EIN05728.1 APC amino acid permease [Punctularia strigosozonata HHB-11173 SS5]